jgi:hypothetical protein
MRAVFGRWFRIVKWPVIAVVGLLLAFLSATVIIHLTWNHERAGRTISRWASEPLAGRGGPTQQAFTFRRVDYPWRGAVTSLLGGRPVRFDAWDVHIWDPEGKEVLYAPHVTAGLRLNRLVWAQLWSALPGAKPDLELHFVDATVDHVRCQLALDHSGQVNLVAAFAPQRRTAPRRGGMVISVTGSVVHDGRFRMRFPGWEAEIDHLRVIHDSLRYSSFAADNRDESPAFTYRVSRVEAPVGKLTVGEYSFPLEHLLSTDFRAEEPRRQDMVLKGTVHSRGATVAVDGRLTQLYGANPGVDLRIDTQHGAGVLASLPSTAMLNGDVSATAHLHGPFKQVIIDGAVRGAELRVVGLDVRHIAARYHLAHQSLHFSQVTSDVAGGHVRGEATFDWKAHSWRANLELEGIHTLKLGALAPLEMLAYVGNIPMYVLRAGQGDHDFSNHLHIHGVDVTLYRRPRDLLPHRISLHGSLGP